MKRVKNVYLFDNGNLAVFDLAGEQIPELQGQYSLDKHKRILLEALEDCEFRGIAMLPGGFIKTAEEWAEHFKGQNLTWEEIKAL